MEGLLKLNFPIDSKIDNGLWYKQKEQKNSHVMQDFIDISIPGDGWRDFPSRNLPQNFNYGNIYHYLVESINKVCCHDDFSFFNWESLHARLNSHYKAWSYKKKSTKKITGYRKSV